MSPEEPQERWCARRSAERLVEFLRETGPFYDSLAAREFFMLEQRVKKMINPKVLSDAKFEVQNNPPIDDDRIQGVG